MLYGYARVSTKGQLDNNSLDEQLIKLLDNGCTEVVQEQFTGSKMDRPMFNELLKKLKPGDTLMVTKLDRFCRNTIEGLETIETLRKKNININILNMGLITNNMMGDVIVTCLLAFSQLERELIIERTQSGRAEARKKEGYKDGRKPKFGRQQIQHALSLLQANGGDYSYNVVADMTGISRSTLIREMNKLRAEKEKERNGNLVLSAGNRKASYQERKNSCGISIK